MKLATVSNLGSTLDGDNKEPDENGEDEAVNMLDLIYRPMQNKSDPKQIAPLKQFMPFEIPETDDEEHFLSFSEFRKQLENE